MQKLILILLLVSPALFASARPVWQWMWVVYVSIACCWVVSKNLLLAKLPDVFGFDKLPPLAWIGLGGFFAVCLYQILFFQNEILSQTALFFLLQAIAYLLFALLVFQYITSRREAVSLLKMVSNIVFLYAVVGFIIYVMGNEYVLWYEKAAYKNSLTSTFINRNSFAAYAGMGLILSMVELKSVLSKARQQEKFDRYYIRDTLQLFFMHGWKSIIKTTLLAVVLLLTASRAGIFSSFIMVFLFLFLSSARGAKGTLKSRLATICSVLIVGMGLFALSGDLLEARLEADVTKDGRFIAYPMIIEGIKAEPITGHGAGAFEEAFQQYRNENLGVYFDRAHNDYLELAFTVGIPATFMVMMAFGAVFFKLMKALDKTGRYQLHLLVVLCIMGQLALHSLVDFSLQMPATAYSFIAIMAAGLVIADRSLKKAR